MNQIETLLTLPHYEDPTLEYVVLNAGPVQYWYLLDTVDEIWYFLAPAPDPYEGADG